MDEYLFIALAKLKADRLQPRREHGFAAPDQQDLFEEPGVAATHRSSKDSSKGSPRCSPKARWLLREPDWPVRT